MSVYKHKNGRWYYKFVLEGIQYHGACKGATDIKQAKKFETEIRSGVYEEGSKYKRKKPVSIKEAMQRYKEYAENNKASYKTDYSFINKIVEFFGNNTIITTITPAKIDDFKTYLKNQKVTVKTKVANPEFPYFSKKRYIDKNITTIKELSASTINKHINALSKAFNLLIADGLIDNNNPCKYTKKSREDDVKIRFLTDDEETRLFDSFTPDTEYLRQIIQFALYTGMRKSEILNLKWTQIDLKNKVIKILFSNKLETKNKGSKSREIPISKKLEKLLTNLDDTQEFVFINPKTKKPYTAVRKSFISLLNRSKIKNFRFHDIRHTVATRLVANGVDLVAIKELLGHSSIETTMMYAHSMPELKKKAVEFL